VHWKRVSVLGIVPVAKARLALMAMVLTAATSRCFAFESGIYENDGDKFREINETWRACDQLLVYWGNDRFYDHHLADKQPFAGSHVLIRREDSTGKPISFTRGDLLELLKNEPMKGVMMICLATTDKSAPSLHQATEELEPFIASAGYKRVIVMTMVNRAHSLIALQILKDTDEQKALDPKAKDPIAR
jgi:hypothetical protein